MEYPDTSTPWKSSEHMLNTMQERDHQGRKRYDVDEGFRDACAAKTRLGFESGTPPVRVEHRTQGTHTLNGTHKRMSISYSHQDMLDAGEIASLKEQLADLEAETAKQGKVEKASALLRVYVDPTQQPTPFAGPKDVVAAMGTPEYRNSERVRQFVKARLAISEPGILTTIEENQPNAPDV